MCRHCERLVEDVAEKQLVHDFMASLAAKVNRKINEDVIDAMQIGVPENPEDKGLLYRHGTRLQNPVTANDIDVKVNVRAVFWHDNPFNGTRAQAEIFRMLMKMWE
jgi:hypothetical protein